MTLKETKMKGRYFYLKTCFQGKIDALHRKGLKALTSWRMDVFPVFFLNPCRLV